jgi:hypothetical protein
MAQASNKASSEDDLPGWRDHPAWYGVRFRQRRRDVHAFHLLMETAVKSR